MLPTTQNADEIYGKWIQSIPTRLIDSSIRLFTSVNLSDPYHRDELIFPLFRFNMHVIDFWLSKVVFPHEAKIFEDKLISTAWDLCSEQLQYPVTGFSGTNDTKNILPLPIEQNDLDELESTNENVRKILLRPENRRYTKLTANASAKMILDKLIDSNIPVLLDAGALMLELNNEQVAKEWLKLSSSNRYDAAIYFDSNDVLQTVDRNNIVTEFDCSVYRENLKRCLVFVDDFHTRGTDLKFPLDWKACVTLSGDITRDKTVQACMRMRQLGRGHSIEFLASFEADLRIRELCDLQLNTIICNEHVIEFICTNSKNFQTANTVHWASAAYNYTRKMAAQRLYEINQNHMALYNGCSDKEFITLREMYSDRKEETLLKINSNKFIRLTKAYSSAQSIRAYIQTNFNAVKKRLRGQAANIKRYVHVLDEEQEKEIEYELEDQRQIERPPCVKATLPQNSFFDGLEELILYGWNEDTCKNVQSILFPLERALHNTKLFGKYKKDDPMWAEHIYVTHDFVNVVDTSSQACDEFLRPVRWIARVDDSAEEDNYRLILLSSYECDRLLPAFRKSTKSVLVPFCAHLNKIHSDLMNISGLYVTGKTDGLGIDVDKAAQIKMFAGSMYFNNETEQNEYCCFMSLIPYPRTCQQNDDFEKGLIKPNGYVPIEHRQKYKCVRQSKFTRNPVDLAVKIIEARHQFMRKESYVAFILERGTKMPINNEDIN